MSSDVQNAAPAKRRLEEAPEDQEAVAAERQHAAMKRQANEEEKEMVQAQASKVKHFDIHPNDEELLADPSPLPKSTSTLSFSPGLHLAPMVRIGSLPTRLLSLRYGADLVWSPEIVDRAIYGCERTVDEKSGLIAFSREGKHIFTTHPIERQRVIFQLGSSSPQWAYQAISCVTRNDDVAGVDLNCGCPKPFSTIGGMGAQLLSTPDLLCDILRAMRRAAPPHVAVSCKIRLLPTKEATQDLVRKIIRTGTIDALTVHCRTKDMRPRQPALPHRLQEVIDIVQEETAGKLPLILNGDAWDAPEARRLMAQTGVDAVMMARGPEGNASSFRRDGGVLSVASVIAPQWVRLALSLDNQASNTKYCLSSMAFKATSSVSPNAKPLQPAPGHKRDTKERMAEIRRGLSKARTVEDLAKALGVDPEEQKKVPIDEVLKEIRDALEHATNASPKEGHDSGTEMSEKPSV